MNDELVAALNLERVGYVRDGKTDRVAQVDAEIARLGGKTPARKRGAKRATSKADAPTAELETRA